MKFRFRFESILKIRRHEQKKEEQKLARLIARQIQISRSIEQLCEKQTQGTRITDAAQTHSVPEIRRQYAQEYSLHQQIWQLKRKQKQLSEEVSRQRFRLEEVSKKARMLEKLKNREKVRFVRDQQHLEQLQQNEIATQMYNRAH